MHIQIIAIGQKIPSWIEQGIQEFAKRLPSDWNFEIKAIKTPVRSSSQSVAQCMALERSKMQALIPKGAFRVVMDEKGAAIDTMTLAEKLKQWQETEKNLVFLIGGPDGIEPSFKKECEYRLRLSDMTLPHALARLLLVEQLYRVWSVNHHHPYHRE